MRDEGVRVKARQHLAFASSTNTVSIPGRLPVAMIALRCMACNAPIGEAIPGSAVRLKCRKRRCNTYQVISVNETGLIRTRVE